MLLDVIVVDHDHWGSQLDLLHPRDIKDTALFQNGFNDIVKNIDSNEEHVWNLKQRLNNIEVREVW